MSEQTQACDIMCEKYLLGEILNRKDAYYDVVEYLDKDCFYESKHSKMWVGIESLANEGKDIDMLTLFAELRQQGQDISAYEIADVSGNFYRGNLVELAIRLRDLKQRRKLFQLGLKLKEGGSTENISVLDLVKDINNEVDSLFAKDKDLLTLSDACHSLYSIINKNLNGDSLVTGSPTGFKMIDKTGGLQSSDLIIIAGETSNGKSSFALSLVKNAIESNQKVAFYSLEMSKEQLAARIVSQESGVSASSILYSASLTSFELGKIDDAIGRIPTQNLYFDDTSTSSLESILLSIRNMKRRFDIDGAVIDYMQILSVNAKNGNSTREQIMGDTARRLKNLAKELDIWIIALSQLSRCVGNPEPTIRRLRDSGQIEEAADLIILVYRPELYNRGLPEPFENVTDNVDGLAVIDVGKGRNRGVFKFLCTFDKKTTKFKDYESSFVSKNDEMPF